MSDGQLPILRPTELVRALERMGFSLGRKSRCSHFRFIHPDGRRTTVPMHEGKTIGRGLLRKILNDIGVDIEELRRYL
ncbi:MAG: type II toxin-antitoxin system HicA family toxin [Armatimonadetes bacterium]|nr:type II toxin-antitoxin system HicA family toxin [Armatimonadota bacterium]